MMAALLAAGIASFAELYAVQAVLPELSATLGVTPADAALTVSTATLGLALGVLPWAWAADRLGRLRSMKISVCAMVVLGTAAVFAPTFEIMLALRFLSGAALAAVPVLAVAYVHEELHGARAAAAATAYISGTTIGGAVGRLVAGPLAPWLGWRGALLVVGAGSLVAAVTFIVLAPVPHSDRRDAGRDGGGGVRAARLPQLPRLRRALADPALAHIYLAAPLITGGFVGVFNFLQFRLGAPPFALPAGVVSLVFLAYGAGTISSRLGGTWLPRIGFPAVCALGLGTMALGVLAMLPDHLGLLVLGLVLFTGGFFVTHAAAVAATGALAAPAIRGQASALYTIGYYVGSGVVGWLVGLVFEAAGWTPFSAVIVGLIALGAGLLVTTPTRHAPGVTRPVRRPAATPTAAASAAPASAAPAPAADRPTPPTRRLAAPMPSGR